MKFKQLWHIFFVLALVSSISLVLSPALPTQRLAAAATIKPAKSTTQRLQQTNAQTIEGSPLRIVVNDDSSTAVYYNGVSQYFSNFAHGIFVWDNGQVYGPGQVPAGNAVNPWTTVSNELSGAGTATNPWVVRTTLRAITIGLVVETSYVNGDPFLNYTFHVSSPSYMSWSLFHAADLYTDGDDQGLPYVDPTTGDIGGTNPNSNFYQFFRPLTPATFFEENGYHDIWAAIGSSTAPGPGFLNRVNNSLIDNGAGLQWNGRGNAVIRDLSVFNSQPTLPCSLSDTVRGDDRFSASVTPASCAGDVDSNIQIGRYYGPTDGPGWIQNAQIGRTIAPTATLSVAAFDVRPGEETIVHFGGRTFTLEPAAGALHQSLFQIDVSQLLLPNKGSLTRNADNTIATITPLTPTHNRLVINRDTTGSGHRGEIRTISLHIIGLRPILLVAGLKPTTNIPDHIYEATDGSAGGDPYFGWSWDNTYDVRSGFILRPPRDGHNALDGGGRDLNNEINATKQMFGVAKVNVIGHSMGGLFGRAAALFDPQSIDRVMMVATPNEGSIAPDTILAACLLTHDVRSLPCQWFIRTSPAMAQMTTSHMPTWNSTHPAAAGVCYVDIAAVIQAGWPRTDGAVTEDSVHALPYTLDLPTIAVGGLANSHNLAKADNRFQDALRPFFVLDNNRYNNETCPSKQAQRSSNDEAVGGEPGMIPPATGTISTGQTQTATLLVDDVQSLNLSLGWQSSTANLQFSLLDPAGRLISATSAYSDVVYASGSFYGPGHTYAITNPRPGNWQVIVQATSTRPGGEPYVIGGQFYGGVQVSANPSSFANYTGRPLSISVLVSDTAAINGATVTATVSLFSDQASYTMSVITLLPQGAGRYVGSYLPAGEGSYYVNVYAGGRNSLRQNFLRLGSTMFQASAAAALSSSYRDRGYDNQGIGFYDELVVSATTTITDPGQYRLAAHLTTEAGVGLTYSSAAYNLTAGSQELALHFSGSDIGRVAADGPYQVRDLYLSRVVSEEIAIAILPIAYTTTAYSRYDWVRTDVALVGTASEQGIDTNANGLFDYLQVTTPLDVRVAAIYSANLSLTAPGGQVVIAAVLSSVQLLTGSNQLTFRFDGRVIGRSNLDGPYRLVNLNVWRGIRGEYATSIPLVLAATRPYLPADFDDGPALQCGNSFSDVPATNIFYSDIQYLACHNVVGGYHDGSFRPNSSSSRGQFAKVAVLAFGITPHNPSSPSFSDVPPSSVFYPYIEAAARQAVISGYPDGSFRANENISRAQVALIIQRARGYVLQSPPTPTFRDVQPSYYAYTAIETLAVRAIFSGANCTVGGGICFRPNEVIRRGELSKIVHRAMTIAP